MGGLFSKNKRVCVFPERVVLYKAKGRKASRTTRAFCDASTWTGENHFYSARIGRTPRGPELSAAELAMDTPESESAVQGKWETGEQAAPLLAQRSEVPLSVTARDTQGAEVSQDPEDKPVAEVMQHQELAEQMEQDAQSARRRSRGSSKIEAGLHPTGGHVPHKQFRGEPCDAGSLSQITVRAEVHTSRDGQCGPGKIQSVVAESEQLTGADPEAGAVCASEETCVGKAHQEVPDSSAALSTAEESELPLKTTETREGTTNVQMSAEGQAVQEEACRAAEAPPAPQLEQGTEVPLTEGTEENAFEPEQAEDMAESCDDGQTSKEIPCCLAETQAAPQDKETIKASHEGQPEEH